MAETADILVIGAGMAGASAAYELAGERRVIVLEQEETPGFHSTGRSAALFSETYGNATVRALSRASRPFLTAPPDGFCETPLLSPRGAMFVASEAERGHLEAQAAEDPDAFDWLSAAEALARVPALRPEAAIAGLYEAGAMDIDVAALHQGYLRGLRQRGGRVVTDAAVASLSRAGGQWTASTGAGAFAAPVVVNAAGAWADKVSALAGLAPLGLAPKRRTVALIDGPPDVDFAAWPLTIEAGETWYFKPDAGRLLISPADETDTEPCDAQPEDLDVAIAVDRIEQATSLQVRRVTHRWAGLRTFAPDRTPVCGFDPRVEGFFWLAGQGGYGIQTAAALAQRTTRLIGGSRTGDEVEQALSPARLMSPMGWRPWASTAP
jgi:D-arginine dehydrogenase